MEHYWIGSGMLWYVVVCCGATHKVARSCAGSLSWARAFLQSGKVLRGLSVALHVTYQTYHVIVTSSHRTDDG